LLLANICVAMVQAYVDVHFYPIYSERAAITYPSGLYLQYNHFANFMLGIGLLSLGIAFDSDRGRLMRIVSWVMYFIALYGVVLSNSRGAIFGLGGGTVVACLGWLMSLWRRKVSWAGMALVISIALAPILLASAWQLGERAIARRGMVDGCRLELAGMALDMIVEKPLWGGGSRSFFFDSLTKWDIKEMYLGPVEVQYVHNEYLQAAVDYGLVGAGLLLAIFSLTFFRGVAFLSMSQKNDGGDTGYVIGSIAALVGMGVQAFFSFVYHVLPDVMLMGLCLALLFRQPWVLSSVEVTTESRRSRIMPAFSLMMGVGIICFAGRDAVVGFILRPRPESSKMSLEEKIIDLQAAAKVCPDFRVMGDLSRAMLALNEEKNLSPEERKTLLEELIILQQALVQRVPQSYEARLNLAILYDATARFEQSAPLYEQIVNDNIVIEVIYGIRYHYTRHLLARAKAVWRKREPERALILLLRAREQFGLIKNSSQSSNFLALKEEIEKSITFLDGANIKPEIENDSN
jgi:O-antigen ligase